MPKANKPTSGTKAAASGSGAGKSESAEYALLDELDLLEELIELMDELNVSTRAEAEARMTALHDRLDALDDEADDA